jgi:hypothetical protein
VKSCSTRDARSGKTITMPRGLLSAPSTEFAGIAWRLPGGYRTWLGRYPDQAVSVAVMQFRSGESGSTRPGRCATVER